MGRRALIVAIADHIDKHGARRDHATRMPAKSQPANRDPEGRGH
ncbi:MAG TPA: hypothetical protein VNY05_26950 [Candidatus Acidoferrales bacterium]|nr:hypothetical protein [Candidatus Acidoferrales bacterium]